MGAQHAPDAGMPQDPKNNPLVDDAIEWLALLRSGHATPADHARFTEWQALSPEHAEAFQAAKELWGIMHLALEEEALPVNCHDGYRGVPPIRQRWPQRWRLAVLATAALLLLAAGLHALHVTDLWLSDHYTGTGEQREVVLADGSRAFLNTDSALSVEYTGAMRQVRLHRGQVLFTVAPKPIRPFEVIADDARVRALGTVFEVYKEPGDAIRVIVQEQAVRIRRDVTGTGAAGPSVRVAGGEQLRWRPNQGLGAPHPVNLRETSAWQRHKLFFKDRPLAQVVAEIDRYRAGAILITDSALKDLRVFGIFPLDDPDGALEAVHQALGLDLTYISPWLVLLHD